MRCSRRSASATWCAAARRRACRSASLSFTSSAPLRTRAPSTKLMAVILPLTSACSSTPSVASSVPVELTVSASARGSITSTVTRTTDSARGAGAEEAFAAAGGERHQRSSVSGQSFGAATPARAPTIRRLRTRVDLRTIGSVSARDHPKSPAARPPSSIHDGRRSAPPTRAACRRRPSGRGMVR